MARSPAPPLSLAGCLLGIRFALPLVPGIVVFGAAFGTAAAQKGLTFDQAVLMSAIVFGGASQMVALEVWPSVWSAAAILGVTTVTGVVNARMILMGATIQPWIAGAPKSYSALTLFLFTDASWLIATRYRSEGGQDLGVLLGSGLFLWLVWTASTVPGFLAGAIVPDPQRYGIDLVLPVFFAAMMVPLWKGLRPAAPWLVAGAAALLAQAVLPGYGFIVIGALAGALAGALLDEPA